MRLVAIDTSGPVVGVALWVDGAVTRRTERVLRGSEALLLPWVVALCDEAGVALDALDGVAVAAGPGAFTGLRVGLATAAGLAASLGVPLWPGSSLTSRALRVADGNLPVLALLDARKGKVYAQLHDPNGLVVRGPEDVLPDEALAWCDGPFLAAGEGAVVYRDRVLALGGRVAGEPADPAVDTLARLAAEALAQGDGQDAVDVRPVYVRPPDAKPPRDGRIK